MTTKRRGIILLMAGIWLISSIHALYAQDTYRSEFALEYCQSEDEADNESDIYGVAAEIYFSPVDTSNHPYAEAAFLERVGSVGVFIGRGETETEWYYGGYTLTGVDEDIYSAALTYATPGLPIFFQAGYAESEMDCEYSNGSVYEASLEKRHLSIGYFVLDNLLIAATYRQEGWESSSIDDDDISLSAKLVQENPDDTAITIGGGILLRQYDEDSVDFWWGPRRKDQENITVNVYGDYYFNRKVSLGCGASRNTGDWEPDESTTVSINGKVFINPAFSIYAAFEHFFINDHNYGVDEDSILFGLSARL